MASVSPARQRPASIHISIISSLALLALACAACISIPNTVAPDPLGLLNAGVLTVASDTSNPPQEFIDPTTQQVSGFDVDLITAIAHRLGLKVAILSTKIETLISDLANKRIDVAISAIPITPDRQAKVNFIPYFSAGESLLVQAGNPHHITSLTDLCGQNVAVQSGSLEAIHLQDASEACQRSRKPMINLTVLKNQFDVIQRLTDQRVVATYQDSPVTDYFIKLHPALFALGGTVINAVLEGIAVGKDNPTLRTTIQKALTSLEADTTYDSIMMKWGLINEAITKD